jgi:hypothetical protein
MANGAVAFIEGSAVSLPGERSGRVPIRTSVIRRPSLKGCHVALAEGRENDASVRRFRVESSACRDWLSTPRHIDKTTSLMKE